MTTAACPRHGVLPQAADTPCPRCATLLYDLDNREALTVVRAARTQGLKARRTVILIALAVMGIFLSQAISFGDDGVSFDFVRFVVVWVIASVAMVPLGTAVEPDPALRALDNALRARSKK